MDTAFLSQTILFRGVAPEEIGAMLRCLGARVAGYGKNELIFRVGEHTDELGLVLSGSVSIVYDDFWGGRSVLDLIGAGRVFAESYACVPDAALPVSVLCQEAAQILFVDTRRLLTPCQNACAHHAQLIRNLLAISARKNLLLSRRIFHTTPKTIRGRLASYLSEQASLSGGRAFSIPFDRQQLADYLNVDRSALSAELSRMRRDGLIAVRKNRFELLSEETTFFGNRG